MKRRGSNVGRLERELEAMSESIAATERDQVHQAELAEQAAAEKRAVAEDPAARDAAEKRVIDHRKERDRLSDVLELRREALASLERDLASARYQELGRRFECAVTIREKLPEPSRVIGSEYGIEHGALVPDGDASRVSDPDPTGEIYLRLLAVDPADEDQILAFVDQYGVLGVRADGFAGLAGFPSLDAEQRRLQRAVASARRTLPVPDIRVDRGHPHGGWTDEPPLSAETVAEFRIGLAALHDLVAARRVTEGNADPKRVEWRLVPAEHVSGHNLAAMWLAHALEMALRPFSPRASVEWSPSSSRPRNARHWKPRFWDVSLYATCALELWNHVFEEAKYRTCKRCGRLFVRQDGRAIHGQYHTSGSLVYCSKRCADAFKSRVYRRRQAATRR